MHRERREERRERREKRRRKTTRAMADADENAQNISHQLRLAVKAAKTKQREKSHRKNCPEEERSGGEDFVVIARCFNVRRVKIVDKRFVTNEIRRKPQDEPENPGIRPFEGGGEVSLEFFAEKSVACFAFANHQKKKRPNAITFGRFYNHKIYDCVEMMVNGESFMSINNFGSVASSTTIGSKPCMMFLGDKFETDAHLKQLKSVFTDIFRGEW